MPSTLLIKFALLFLLLPTLVLAEARPKWELGLAAGRGIVPDYPASDETTTHTIAIPTFIYRGSIVRSDRRGTRARLFKNNFLDIDISFGGSLPASSHLNKTREGMADLDFMMELGPRANWTLLFDEEQILELEFPYRYVFSTDLEHTEHRGYRFVPQIDYRRTIWRRFRIGLSLALNYGTEKLNDYFYEVNGSDINSKRERFNAKAGYIGQYTSVNFIYRHYPALFDMGYRVSNHNGATNQNSPLFKTTENHSIFFAFNYWFYQSKQMGESTNDLSR